MAIQAKSSPSGGFHRASPSPAATSEVYFSVDIETDGPIPGPYSMLSFAIVQAGTVREGVFTRPSTTSDSFYVEMQPISDQFQTEALAVNKLDRARLVREGVKPEDAMAAANDWIVSHSEQGTPVLVAYPLGFDWSFLYWYFIRFAGSSPFSHSRCFDMKTAISVKGRRPIARSGHKHLPKELESSLPHTHNALDDARSQADIFAKLMEWDAR